MKITKKFLSAIVCATMAATSMVGVTASAGFNTTGLYGILGSDGRPSRNPLTFRQGGTEYGFKISSTVDTSVANNGELYGTAKSTVYETHGYNISSSSNNGIAIFVQTYLSTKSNGHSWVVDGSSDLLDGATQSTVYAISPTRHGDSCYAASGYARIMWNSMFDQEGISTPETSYLSY